MKNLKKFENFDGFSADEESDQMNNDQIYAQDAQDAQAFDGEESQEEEGLELDEVVDRVLATIEECGDDCDQEEIRSKVKAVLADFHQAQEEEDDNYDPENDEDFGEMRADGSDDLGYDDEEGQEDAQQYEGLKKFSDFK